MKSWSHEVVAEVSKKLVFPPLSWFTDYIRFQSDNWPSWEKWESYFLLKDEVVFESTMANGRIFHSLTILREKKLVRISNREKRFINLLKCPRVTELIFIAISGKFKSILFSIPERSIRKYRLPLFTSTYHLFFFWTTPTLNWTVNWIEH